MKQVKERRGVAAGVGALALLGLVSCGGVEDAGEMEAALSDPGRPAGRPRLAQRMSVEQAVEGYRRDPEVLYAEPNYIYDLNAVPNDPGFGQLWGLHNTGQLGGIIDADINAPEAWNITTGSSNVVIGVLDTGVDYTHQDLAANMFTNPGEIAGNGIDDDGNGWVDDVHGISATAESGDPMDTHGHGTHVSGTIAARGNNGIGVAGVSWNAVHGLLPRPEDPAEQPGRHRRHEQLVGRRPALAGAVRRDQRPPAGHDNIISVLATDRFDQRAYFSNYGPPPPPRATRS
jgi:subtilisin family serine protease